MSNTTVISTVTQFERILHDPNHKGKTFEVSREVFEQFHSTLHDSSQQIEEQEKRSLKNLLCLETSDLTAGLTRDCSCSHCGHRLSFVDHVASAILSGAHTAEEMRTILTGPQHWLTVDTDQVRAVRCPRCYLDFDAVHCCYTSSNYAYA